VVRDDSRPAVESERHLRAVHYLRERRDRHACHERRRRACAELAICIVVVDSPHFLVDVLVCAPPLLVSLIRLLQTQAAVGDGRGTGGLR